MIPMMGDLNGGVGTGKTLLLTLFAKMCEGKMPIYANFTLKVKGAKLITINDLEGINSGLLLIDEAYAWLESRTSTSRLNQYMSRIIFQSRKRRLHMFAAEQIRSSIDLRFRDMSALTILALDKNQDMDNNDDSLSFDYVYQRNYRLGNIHIPMKLARKLYPLYDTYEFPQTPPSEFEPNRLNKTIKKTITELKKKYGKNVTRLTKSMISDYLMEKKNFERGLHESIYARIKREGIAEA